MLFIENYYFFLYWKGFRTFFRQKILGLKSFDNREKM